MNDPQPEGHKASYIGRRKFLAALGSAAVWPLAVRAQQGDRMRWLAAIMGGRNADTDPEGRAWFAAFRQGLEELGWVEGRNFRADYRWPSGERFWKARGTVSEFLDRLYGVALAPLRLEQRVSAGFRKTTLREHLYLYLKDVDALRGAGPIAALTTTEGSEERCSCVR
jgi:hypothetical protein